MKKRNLKFGFPKWSRIGNPLTKFLIGFLLIAALIISLTGHSQYCSHSYSIIRNGNKIGTLRFSQTVSGTQEYMRVESEVKARFILSFNVKATEDALYSNGVLVKSSIYRQTNGNVKANKQLETVNNQYVIHDGRRQEISKNYPITSNMLSLYACEPVNISQVYSDSYETFLNIEKPEPHKYKITLPGGDYNLYHYENGILKTVEIHTDLYTAKVQLTNS
jgi:hypothetical protein